MAESPDKVQVLEDVEPLLQDKSALGVLRAALERPPGSGGGLQERRVTWSVKGERREVSFSGGVIMLANRPPPDTPEVEAILTRIPVFHFKASDAELCAFMRSVALAGYRRGERSLTADECSAVCEHLIAEAAARQRPLNLRLLEPCFGDYLLWLEGHVGCHWKDLIANRVAGQGVPLQHDLDLGGRAKTKLGEILALREIIAQTDDREQRRRLWEERTGKSEKSMYRRLSELRKMDELSRRTESRPPVSPPERNDNGDKTRK